MKKVLMAMTMLFALGCWAQAGSGAGSASSSSGTSSSPQASTSSSGSMDNGQSGSMSSSGMKGEKTLKGCIESQNGGYMLQEKHGKEVMLSGSDLSAHVGHEVKVHGMWQNGAAGSTNSGSMASNSAANNAEGSQAGSTSNGSGATTSSSSTGSMGQNGNTFAVTKVDMVSDQCKMDNNKH